MLHLILNIRINNSHIIMKNIKTSILELYALEFLKY